MRNLSNLSPTDVKAYLAGLKDEENKNKLITVIIVGSIVIGILVAGIVYLIKNKYDECDYDEWDDEWDDDECCCGDDDCCCTDNDVDNSVKVKKIDE